MDAGISISDLSRAADTIAETNHGLSGSKIITYCNYYASDQDVRIPNATYPFEAPNKRTALLENLRVFSPTVQYELILELCSDISLVENASIQLLVKWFTKRYSRFTESTSAHTPLPMPIAKQVPVWEMPKTDQVPTEKSAMNPSRHYDIFLSYSHDDEELMNLVREHLVIYDRLGLIRKWWDRKLLGGQTIDGSLSEQLTNSDIILLFVSSSFLSSDYCYETEMKQAMAQNESGSSVVVPVIIRPCNWRSSPFGNLLALPTDGKAITQWENRDEAASVIAEGVMRIVADLQAR